MPKEIKTAEELKAMLEGRIRLSYPGVVSAPIVVILRTEEGESNWTASHSGQSDDVAAAIDRIVPGMQARYELRPPGEGST